jgi:hypothetical protein
MHAHHKLIIIGAIQLPTNRQGEGNQGNIHLTRDECMHPHLSSWAVGADEIHHNRLLTIHVRFLYGETKARGTL